MKRDERWELVGLILHIFSRPSELKNRIELLWILMIYGHGGERGIRTLDTLLEYARFPGVCLKPLGHLSVAGQSGIERGPHVLFHEPASKASSFDRSRTTRLI